MRGIPYGIPNGTIGYNIESISKYIFVYNTFLYISVLFQYTLFPRLYYDYSTILALYCEIYLK